MSEIKFRWNGVQSIVMALFDRDFRKLHEQNVMTINEFQPCCRSERVQDQNH